MIITSIPLTLPIGREQFIEQAKSDPVKAGQSLDEELRNFDTYLQQIGSGPMARHEREVLREYIAFKLIKSIP